MHIEQLELPFAKTTNDIERDRLVKVTIEVPFFGKEAQARKFVEERLDRILRSGVTERTRIESYKIT